MTQQTRIRRLLYRSWHRGTREMDLLMGRFADAHLAQFTGAQLDDYETLLTENDPDLYAWVTGAQALPADKAATVLPLLCAYHDIKKTD